MFHGAWRNAGQSDCDRTMGQRWSFRLTQWTASAVVRGLSLSFFFYPPSVLSCVSWCVLASLGLFSRTNCPPPLDPVESDAAIVPSKHKLLHIGPFRLQTLERRHVLLHNG